MRRLAVVLLGVVAVLGAWAPAGASRSEDPPGRPVSWLAMGDSYSSGEGIPDAGPPCARSASAYGPLAARLLREQRSWTISPEHFVACTGDVAGDLFHDRGASGDRPAGSQVDWARAEGFDPSSKADVVLFSFGGNDIGFGPAIRACIEVPTSWGDLGSYRGRRCAQIDGRPFEDGMRARIDDLAGSGDRSDALGPAVQSGEADGSLSDLYRRALDELVTDDGVLVVLGYPRIFAPVEEWGAWRGDRCATLHKDDARSIDRLSVRLDEAVADAVRQADPGGSRILHLSRLELFDRGPRSHALCGGDVEWINRVTLGLRDPAIRPERSFHPNAPGHAATAREVARRLDGWFPPAPLTPPEPQSTTSSPPRSTAPTTTTTERPPISVDGTYEIGTRFDASCVVAWPTAPVRTSRSIQLRMSCASVPSQFLFVDVLYDDPDLPITPSTGSVRVRGRVGDVAESELGFRTLIVLADEIDL